MEKTIEDYKSEPLSPLSNIIFTKIFENNDAREALKHFLNAVLRNSGDLQVEEIVEVKSEYALLGELIEEARANGASGLSRGGRIDVKAKAGDGRLFCVEMQMYEEPLMTDRSIFYNWLIVRDEFPAGKGYQELPVTIIINLLKVGIRCDPTEYHNVIGMTYLNGVDRAVASDRVRIHSIELDAFERLYGETPTNELPELGIWLRYMTSGYKSEKEEREMIDMNKELEEFAKRYHYAADDPRLREKYEFIMSGIRDEQTRLNRARGQGRAEGRTEGREDGIQALIETLNEIGTSRNAAKEKCMEKFKLLSEAAEDYMKRYWKS